ncbi:myb/SANT-like DNA-binding domain-containing protein 3 [Penaeus japonicus]|uniref:myb/SANT-like DNA-binding domain-containing protein 3 n=1 Tax=Penaeus japonicus TaxID=27405 RepID=UPI001C7173D9|nr:myb/SANT-like DNA-binding domain-containing protein 3 [Penaeus japonicus]
MFASKERVSVGLVVSDANLFNETYRSDDIGSLDRFCKNPSLTQDQLLELVILIKEREGILFCKKSDPRLPSQKNKCWQEICDSFNASNPEQNPRSVKQVKRTWEYIRRRVKEKESAHLQERRATGGGPPPTQGFSAPHMEIARSMLCKDLALGNTAVEFGSSEPFPSDYPSRTSSRAAPTRKRRLSEEEAYAHIKKRQDELRLLKMEAAREDLLAARAKRQSFEAAQKAAESVEKTAKVQMWRL